MSPAAELQQVDPRLFLWQAFDPKVKAHLFSTAILARDELLLIDPIPLNAAGADELSQTGTVAGIIVTNANHLRAAEQFSELYGVPIYASHDSFPDKAPPRFTEVRDGMLIRDKLEVIAIDGAVSGEIVLCDSAGAALIVGDALINFEPYGFTFLPGKYCSNQKRMRRSLQKLLGRHPEKILFAHGTPILSQASARLERLLESAS